MRSYLARAVREAARDETGQSHILGFALCLPLVLAAMFFLVGLCWLGWQTVSFDHALYQTAWSMDGAALDKALSEGDADELVRASIASDWTMLDDSQLEVSNASIKEVASHEERDLTGEEDHDGLLIERVSRESRYARVTADVSYTVKLPFAVAGVEGVVLERRVDKVQQVSFRFEVS